MKKGYSALCLALAAAMAASVGVSAASAVTKDDFSDYKRRKIGRLTIMRRKISTMRKAGCIWRSDRMGFARTVTMKLRRNHMRCRAAG